MVAYDEENHKVSFIISAGSSQNDKIKIIT